MDKYNDTPSNLVVYFMVHSLLLEKRLFLEWRHGRGLVISKTTRALITNRETQDSNQIQGSQMKLKRIEKVKKKKIYAYV